MTNKKLGNDLERRVCEYLRSEGYWVHNFASNTSGQPADIIASRNYHAYLIDAKVCSNGTFPLTRIEPNQHSAMTVWNLTGNGTAWFACELPDESIWMVCYERIKKYLDEGKKTMDADDIREGILLEVWAKSCGRLQTR